MTGILACVAGMAWACGSGGRGGPDAGADAQEIGPDISGDPGVEAAPDAADAEVPGDCGCVDDGAGDLARPDVPPERPPLPTQAPLPTPADPLAGTAVESCSIYLDERCSGGTRQTCDLYDTGTKQWVEDPDPLLRRVLLFERWRDLYHSPDGQTSERDFNVPTPPGTPEAEWAASERFRQHEGMGDSGIWTGWTTVAAILRYSQTGTQADYERMERLVRSLLTMYDVTGVPGTLCRHHFVLLPPDAPRWFPGVDRHVFRWADSMTLTHHDRPVDPAALAELPDVYTEGIVDAEGQTWVGTPMWHGRPSIDQNTGPMTALPMAYSLLRDDSLRQRIAHHLTCYLKRLQRIELVNLQKNLDLLDALTKYLSAGELNLDPDDMDLTKMDRIVGYVQRQINTANEATFDRSCPDHVQMQPWRVIDATSDTFLLDLWNLVQDMGTDEGRENQIDHYYFPSVRGGDAMHLMHLATMAYYFTGDEQYRTFLYDELIGNLRTLDVVDTAGAFSLPKFCKQYYGDQITYGPWWAFLHLLGEGEVRTRMQRAFHKEMWDKLMKVAGNVDFDIMYAGALPPEVAKDREQALAYAMEHLPRMGGNGWVGGAPLYDDPRRSYTLTPDFVLAHAPAGIEAVCPTEKEVAACTATIDFMGIPLPPLAGFDTHPCTGDAYECVLPDGTCTDKMTSGPLPVDLRQHTDYLWQRNPFALRKGVGIEGGTQYPGTDLSVPYWNARRYGFITAGAGQVLAWRDAGGCDED